MAIKTPFTPWSISFDAHPSADGVVVMSVDKHPITSSELAFFQQAMNGVAGMTLINKHLKKQNVGWVNWKSLYFFEHAGSGNVKIHVNNSVMSTDQRTKFLAAIGTDLAVKDINKRLKTIWDTWVTWVMNFSAVGTSISLTINSQAATAEQVAFLLSTLNTVKGHTSLNSMLKAAFAKLP